MGDQSERDQGVEGVPVDVAKAGQLLPSMDFGQSKGPTVAGEAAQTSSSLESVSGLPRHNSAVQMA